MTTFLFHMQYLPHTEKVYNLFETIIQTLLDLFLSLVSADSLTPTQMQKSTASYIASSLPTVVAISAYFQILRWHL